MPVIVRKENKEIGRFRHNVLYFSALVTFCSILVLMFTLSFLIRLLDNDWILIFLLIPGLIFSFVLPSLVGSGIYAKTIDLDKLASIEVYKSFNPDWGYPGFSLRRFWRKKVIFNAGELKIYMDTDEAERMLSFFRSQKPEIVIVEK